MYEAICRPTRRLDIVNWMYASVEHALFNLI